MTSAIITRPCNVPEVPHWSILWPLTVQIPPFHDRCDARLNEPAKEVLGWRLEIFPSREEWQDACVEAYRKGKEFVPLHSTVYKVTAQVDVAKVAPVTRLGGGGTAG
jgi:hypothetical protein